MLREPAPDEKERIENWNSTAKYAQSLFCKAFNEDNSNRRQYYLEQTKNVLAGIPDNHPIKIELLNKLRNL